MSFWKASLRKTPAARLIPARRLGGRPGDLVSKRTYHPERGDVVHLNFSPSAGREFTGPHYGIVISPARFNRQTGLMICLPTTTKFHDHNLQLELPATVELKQRGWVWIHQIKT